MNCGAARNPNKKGRRDRRPFALQIQEIGISAAVLKVQEIGISAAKA
jgi:hypothetical protein